MDDEMRPLWARYRQLEESAGRAEVTDDDSAAKAVDLDAMLASLLGRVDNTHERVKAPYLEAGRTVDGLANKLREEIAPLRKRLGDMLTAFQVKRKAEIEAAQAAEREAEKEDPEPGYQPQPTSPRRAARIRGDRGASAHLREVEFVVIDDVKKVPKSILEHEDVQAAIKKVVKPLLKANQEVKGCRLETEERSFTKK